jgi:hypothetical protein
LRNAIPYRDLRPIHFDRIKKRKAEQPTLLRRLRELGYETPLSPKAG